jgi:hypothetical protein
MQMALPQCERDIACLRAHYECATEGHFASPEPNAKPPASSAESRQIEVSAFEEGSGRCALNQPVWVVPATLFAMQSPEEVIRCWTLDILLLVRHVLRRNFFSRADFLFLAFALLALLHLFQSITSFNSGAPLGVEIEVMYSLISLLLLTGNSVSVVRRHGPTIGRSKNSQPQ